MQDQRQIQSFKCTHYAKGKLRINALSSVSRCQKKDHQLSLKKLKGKRNQEEIMKDNKDKAEIKQKINKAKNWFFKKRNKIDNLLRRMAKKKEKENINYQYLK